MTPQEKQELKQHLAKISEIFLKNTSADKLKDFESIELTIREHFLEEIGPEIANFFSREQLAKKRGELER